jgi:hypothetical protein
VIEELREARRVISEREGDDEVSEQAAGNGGGEGARSFAASALTFSRGMAQIDAWGVIVRDLDTGICDFPALREGREVFLCWQVGEERVGFWHEVEAGFAGRQAIDDEAFGPRPPDLPPR